MINVVDFDVVISWTTGFLDVSESQFINGGKPLMPDPDLTLIIKDGNALFHHMSEISKKFQDISMKAKRLDAICSSINQMYGASA